MKKVLCELRENVPPTFKNQKNTKEFVKTKIFFFLFCIHYFLMTK